MQYLYLLYSVGIVHQSNFLYGIWTYLSFCCDASVYNQFGRQNAEG